MKKLLILTLFYFFSSSALTAEPASSLYVLCKLKGNIRTLRVTTKKSNICKVAYTKNGAEAQIGRAKDMATCQDVASKVQAKLVQVGWECRDITDSRISSYEQ